MPKITWTKIFVEATKASITVKACVLLPPLGAREEGCKIKAHRQNCQSSSDLRFLGRKVT